MSSTSASRFRFLHGLKVARMRTLGWTCRNTILRTTTSVPVVRSQARHSSRLTYSISQGPSEPPLLPHTIPEHFAEIVSKYGDRPAVICRSPTTTGAAEETTLSYAALDSASNALAQSLRSLGVKKGDRVAVKLGNTVEHATVTYAVFKLGAILVPLNPNFNAAQVAAALSHLGVEVLVIGAVADRAYKPCQGRSNLELLRSLAPDLGSGRIESPNVPTLKTAIVVDNTPSYPAVRDFRLDDYPSLTPYPAPSPAAPTARLSDHLARPVVPDTPLSPDETINIQFTSGTTSSPKAAMLSHAGILNNGHLVARRMGLTPADLVVCPPPLFHCFGCVIGYMATAATGAAILFPSPAFDPLASLKMAADHRATGLYGVSTMFVSMLEVLDNNNSNNNNGAPTLPILPPQDAAQLPTHLRTGVAAGSSVPEPLMRAVHDRLGLRDLAICYGMTETSPVSCMTAPDDPPAMRTGSVGRAMPHTRVKIVDPRDRRRGGGGVAVGPVPPVPVGVRGELAASGYLVMQGYWGDGGKTGEVRVLERDADDDELDGEEGRERWWMYSGDEACMTEDGYVSITGRIKDLIIRGGENIHPLEVENVLFQHPLVAEASVVGVPDGRYGEEVCAFIVPRGGVAVVEQEGGDGDGDEDRKKEEEEEEEEPGRRDGDGDGAPVLRREDVRRWVAGRLSGHLVPRYVFWTEEYPKTASGKIQKYRLREVAVGLLRGRGVEGGKDGGAVPGREMSDGKGRGRRGSLPA